MGRKPEDNIFRTTAEDDPGVGVRSFFGVGLPEDPGQDIDLVRRYDFYRDRIPSWTVPIGEDDTGEPHPDLRPSGRRGLGVVLGPRARGGGE